MQKTPDDIKKGMECCRESQDCTQDNMPKCPYYEKKTCLIELVDDALALIQQLEKDKDDLLEERELNDFLRDKVKQLEAERDALLKEIRVCIFCDRDVPDACPIVCEHCQLDCPCKDCVDFNKWQRRVVQKEETR